MNADAIRQWLLRRRRAASVKRRPAGRRTALALLASLLVLLGAFAWCLSYLSPASPGRELTLDQLGALGRGGRVAAATFRDEDSRIVGRYSAAPAVLITPPAAPEGQSPATIAPAVTGLPRGAGSFWASYAASGSVTARLLDQLEGAGARVEFDSQPGKQKVRLVTTFLLPLMILANLFALLFAALCGGTSAIGDVMTFGSIGQKRLRRGESAPVTFADVAGADEAVAELREVVDYLTNPARYEQLGAMPPKGVLLFGPPGCGKTLLAKAVAGEAGVPFFSVNGAEFVESLVGVGAARVRDLFARVRAVAPAIVFIDELDAAGRRRGVGGGTGGSDEREQTLNQLLVEMDGFAVSSGIVVMGATNRPDIIDPALMRPGRFDRHITLDPPDGEGRSKILALHASKKPLAGDVDLATLARRTPGFTGADLANVVNEAALLAVRRGSRSVHQADLEEAIDRVLHGPQRRGRVLTAEDRLRLATHEAGHAIVAAATGRSADVHRVSILTRGRGLATTTLAADADSAVVTESRLLARLATTLGGLAAEELALGEASTGAEDDLEEATALARDIAGRWGMSPELGRARLLASDAELYLGDASALGWLSTEAHETLDREVRRLLDEAEANALRLLRAHRAALDALVNQLLVEETLEGDDLAGMLAKVHDRQNGRTASARPPVKRHAVILGLGVLVALGLVAVIGQGFVPEKTRVDTLTAPEGTKRVVVDVGSGPVVVTGAASGPVRVERTRKWRVGEPDVSVARDGDTYTVRGKCGRGFVVSFCSLRHEVRVPVGVAIEVRTGSGDVEVRGVRAHVTVETGSGHIELAALRDGATARTGSGDIDVRDVTGGRLELRTGSGSVSGSALDVPGVVTRTGAGDVRLAFSTPVDAVDVETGSGDVHLVVAPVTYAVDADAGSGSINVEVPQDPASRRTLRVRTGSGRIEITPADAR